MDSTTISTQAIKLVNISTSLYQDGKKTHLEVGELLVGDLNRKISIINSVLEISQLSQQIQGLTEATEALYWYRQSLSYVVSVLYDIIQVSLKVLIS